MLPILEVVWLLILFAIATLGVGAAVAPRGIPEPLLRLGAGVCLAISGWFVGGWIGFVFGLSNASTAILLASSAALVLVIRRKAISDVARAPEVRGFVGRWVLFVLWSLALLGLVVTYSGGGWAADWLEHWQRTGFFLERQSLTTRFAGDYLLTARPPLANLVIALALPAVGSSFAHYQVLMTLLGTLILLPTMILARRWNESPATTWWVLLVLMASPLVAQNLTFAWTKLPTAFFVLMAVALLWPTATPSDTLRRYGALALGLGLVTHYSAAPWAIALAVALLFSERDSWRDTATWCEWLSLAGIFAALPALWLGWATVHFGAGGVAGANTTAMAWQNQHGWEHVTVIARNLYDTAVPFLLRGEPAGGLIIQASQLGRLRDLAFNTYQVNLPLAFGFGGLAVLAFRVFSRRPALRDNGPAQPTSFLVITGVVAAITGVAVHTIRDEWGLVHICLQPLVLLGLARIAAELARGGAIVGAWIALAAIDAGLGIALHFGLESWALAPLVAPGADGRGYLARLSPAAGVNAAEKAVFQLRFLSDEIGVAPLWLGLLLMGLLAAVAVGIRRAATAPRL